MSFHIVRSKEQFQVVLLAKNGEVLSSSERLSSKQKAWGNIRSQIGVLDSRWCLVQDDTLDKPTLYTYVYTNGARTNEDYTVPKYIPGKNKKRSK